MGGGGHQAVRDKVLTPCLQSCTFLMYTDPQIDILLLLAYVPLSPPLVTPKPLTEQLAPPSCTRASLPRARPHVARVPPAHSAQSGIKPASGQHLASIQPAFSQHLASI
jgi:hypothetical protein